MSASYRPHRRRDCSAVREQLPDFVLEQLSPRDAGRIESHLARCSACRRTAASERDLFSLLPQALDPVAPPPAALLELLRRVHATPRPRRRALFAGLAASLLIAAIALLETRPIEAASLARALASPEIAVIDLFAVLDSPVASRYEYRAAQDVRYDQSVGRILFNVATGDWRLLVHGLPQPPSGARYALFVEVGEKELELGPIEPRFDGVANLSGTSTIDLTGTVRLSLQLVSEGSRLHLLDAVDGAW